MISKTPNTRQSRSLLVMTLRIPARCAPGLAQNAVPARPAMKHTAPVNITDPQGKFLEALAQKTCVPPDELRKKIEAMEAALKAAYERSSKIGSLEIFHLKNYPTQSVFASEDYVIVTPYQTASGRRVIPLFVYEDNRDERCYARDVKNDLKNVRAESKSVFTGECSKT